MRGIRTLILIVAITALSTIGALAAGPQSDISPTGAAAAESDSVTLIIGQSYLLTGDLSKDLSIQPSLDAIAPNGLPVSVNLKIPSELQLKTFSLRGKTIRAKIKILKKFDPRHYEGEVASLRLESTARLSQH